MDKSISISIIAVMIFSTGLVSSAFADAVNNNANAIHISVGQTIYIGYSIHATGQNGCDASPLNPITVSLQGVPAGVTSSPSTLTFTSCDSEQNFSFTATESAVPNPDGPPYKVTVNVVSGSGVDNLAGGNLNIFVNGITPTVTQSDTTAPQVTGIPDHAPNANGWYNSPVTIIWTGIDAEGSVTCDAPTTYSGPDGSSIVLTGSCTDESGNVGTGTITTNYDATAPTVSHVISPSPNANGWYNQDVTVTFTATDALSGISGSDTLTSILGEGANQSTGATFTDLAGNSASDAVSGINVDKTAPTVSVTQAIAYIIGQPASSNAACNDSLSGISSCTIPAVNTSLAGPQSYTVGATDLAGNTNSVLVTYTVNYGCISDGFQSPVPNRQYKIVSGVPEKFLACDYYHNPISTLKAWSYVDDIAAKSKGSSNTGNLFRYDPTAKQYIYNLDTTGITIGTHILKAVLDSGQAITATVSLAK